MSKIIASARSQSSAGPEGGADRFLPFTKPSLEPSDIAAVVEVLQSGWITSGAKVKQLEKAFTEQTGAKHAVAVTSATAGMHLVLHALGVGPGDEVITPSLTWVSTVNLICLSGATPVFVDVDRHTLMTTAAIIEKAITPKTKMIIPVHYAGAPLDLGPIRALERAHGIPVIEDAAHALGSGYMNEAVGKSGTAIFSLQAIKNVTTAEGGVICTQDDAFAERLRRLRFHGLGADSFDRHTNSRLPNAEVLEPGYKYNLPDMNACLALGQLDRLQENNRKRAAFAEKYHDAFANVDAITPLGLPDYPHVHAWHIYIVRVEIDQLSIDRGEFMAALKELGIGTGLHFRAAHQHKYYRESLVGDYATLINTNWNSDRLVTIPLFPDMTDADVDRVIAAVSAVTTRYAA